MSDRLDVYLEMNLVCIAILIVLMWRSWSKQSDQTTILAFRDFVRALILVLVLDSVLALSEERSWILSETVSVALFIQSTLVCYLWLRFVDAQIHASRRSVAMRIVTLLPLLASAFLAIASIRTGWIFYIDADCVYRRGPLFAIQMALAFSYPIAGMVETILSLRRGGAWDAGLRESLLAFCVLGVVGLLATFAFPGSPAVWPCATLAAGLVFANNQDYSILTDGLTGLNNRRRFDMQLQEAADEIDAGRAVCLLMIDIDGFKRINDRFGHLAGDEALMEVAHILGASVGGTGAFLARYGGDEFVILRMESSLEEVVAMREDILRRFAERNDAPDRPFSLEVSVGIGEGRPGEKGIESLVKQADADMYSCKGTTGGGRRTE